MNRASRTVWPLVVGLVCSVVLVGCVSSAQPGGKLPSSSVSSLASRSVTPSVVPTVPVDVPLSGPNLLGPGEKLPVMPVAALRHDAAGAAAFAEFFIQTLDWGIATTSSNYVRHYYDPSSCGFCKDFFAEVDAARSASQHYVGGRITVKSAETASTSGGPADSTAAAVITIDIADSKLLRPDGSVVSHADPVLGRKEQAWLAWRSNGWIVLDLGIA